MDLQNLITEIAEEIAQDAAEIEAAADAKDEAAEPGAFGIAIVTPEQSFATGAADTPFPIQSISKVFAFNLALAAHEDHVFDRVGREPSGDPFNSVIDLERTHGIPRNPFINAGALVVVDLLLEARDDKDVVVAFVGDQFDHATVTLDEAVLAESGDLNRAMLSFMKHHGNLTSPTARTGWSVFCPPAAWQR